MAKKDLWKQYTNPKDVVNHLSKVKYDIDRYYILRYFGNKTVDLPIFKALLNSGYYKSEELVHSIYFNSMKFSDARKLLLEHINKAWQDLKDPNEIANLRVKFVTSIDEEIVMKLKYFFKNDKDICKGLEKEYS